MSKRQNQDLFNHFVRGLDSKMQAQLNYMFAHNQQQNESERRREMEQMKREITDDVLSRISIQIEQTAFEAINKAINRLGQ